MTSGGDGALIVLAEIAELLQVTEDAPARMQRALVLLQRVLPYDRCTLIVPHGTGAMLHAVPPPPRAAHEEPVARLAAILLQEQTAADAARPQAHSHLALPLVAHSIERGVILVERRAGPPYDEAALRMLSIVSAQLGSYVAYCTLVETQRAELAERQALLAAAESASRVKDEFLAVLGHELRNPLSPILTALDVLRLRGVEAGALERAIIHRQVQRLVRLIDDLLDVSRITRGNLELKLKHVELAEVVAMAVEAASPLLDEKEHRLVVAVAPSGLPVRGDPARLAQVLSNLVINAAKYTNPRGSIAIRAEVSDGQVEVSVSDNGVGIAPELLQSVFEMFVQGRQGIDRSQGGLGLGLAIVRSLVELHGGTVSATSEGIDRGSTFTVRLPLVSAADELPPSREPPPVRASRAVRVLVVDDNADAAEMAAMGLEGYGYDVRTSFDGPRALELAAAFEPEIAILDIGLPAMDGYELATHLHAVPGLHHLPLIAVTGYGQVTDRARSEAAGFSAHLVKPVPLTQLEQTVSSLVGSAGAAASSPGRSV